ncbi:MAG: MFS transporter [Sphaerochaetaceae bacterium]|nr:MFS transporter [Sphaerochaetaceae bacterium]
MKSLYLKARAACALLLVIEFCSGLVFFSPVSTLYRQSRRVNISQIGIIESISLAVMMALEIPWGTLAEKIGYKKTLMICSLLSLVSKIMFWKADSFLLFLLERIVLSFALAGISGVDYAYISSFLKPDQMTRFFGRYNGVFDYGSSVRFADLLGFSEGQLLLVCVSHSDCLCSFFFAFALSS